MAGEEQQDVRFNFKGDASSIKSAAGQTADSLKKVEEQSKSTSATTVAGGVLMADALKKVANEAMSFAKTVFGSFNDVAGQTRAMQRVLGGTA